MEKLFNIMGYHFHDILQSVLFLNPSPSNHLTTFKSIPNPSLHFSSDYVSFSSRTFKMVTVIHRPHGPINQPNITTSNLLC